MPEVGGEGVSRCAEVDLIRRVLANLKKEGKIKALGTGRGAQWEKT